MKYYAYLCTMVDARDYTVGGPKLKVHNVITLEIVHLQFAKNNSNCQKPELGAKVLSTLSTDLPTNKYSRARAHMYFYRCAWHLVSGLPKGGIWERAKYQVSACVCTPVPSLPNFMKDSARKILSFNA